MKTRIVWMRQDLRLTDNPALYHATQGSDAVIPAYIHAPEEAAPWAPGAASNWWRHHSLKALDHALKKRNSQLLIRFGPSLDALQKLITESGASEIFWNRLYEPQLLKRDRQIKQTLEQQGIRVHEFDGALLYKPGTVLTKEQKPYRVFSRFWHTCQQLGLGEPPLPTPSRLSPLTLASENIETLGLLPDIPWDHGLRQSWQPGEASAFETLHEFCDTALETYDSGRDTPGKSGTSRLSPHLAFGEISPRQVAAAVLNTFIDHTAANSSRGAETFIQELGWREFANHSLYHFPYITDQVLNKRFEHFPWQHDECLFSAWQQGKTGFPIIDAGMRQLWQTGWMHNRVRMVVASFLTKNGLISWQQGARWFWDTLVDADLASNSFNWQWVAGCGLDAAPYFRIFNPIRQSEKFDPNALYLSHWLPELAKLPTRWLHTPWLTPDEIQFSSHVHIGKDYPLPILDLNTTRKRALNLSKQLPMAS